MRHILHIEQIAVAATDDEVVDQVGHIAILIDIVGIDHANAIHIEVIGVEIGLQRSCGDGKYAIGALGKRGAGCGVGSLPRLHFACREKISLELNLCHVGGVEGECYRVIGIDCRVLGTTAAHRNLLCLKRKDCASAHQKSK